ncbi:MAG: isoprenyl transferase [Deltaproteobacteria bacterium]|nr:isoprenyl transferase [Deltaproteobacteria bacterium]MBW1953221.1 isoprenyl transferase [Deltaproteobacteria bacterium]MBW1985680.1 isoprenyl transferase [Deltaproteobacteria bacterium]MBW2134593.1 isoprenyl transferase [Deltaproteobacteria bacterium]
MQQLDLSRLPQHVAIIMDGNGRWAKQQGLSRLRGHHTGAESAREVVRTAREVGIRYLTLYAFSEENWQRPRSEVQALMILLKQYLRQELPEMLENGIAFQVIGNIRHLPLDVQEEVAAIVSATAANQEMTLTLALSYGGRSEIVQAVQAACQDVQSGRVTVAELTSERFSTYLYTSDFPDPDLLIRTSGEFRLSNFLLWQLAYTELYFTDTLWPDFRRTEFLQALLAYQQRNRRFGLTQEQIEAQAPPASPY